MKRLATYVERVTSSGCGGPVIGIRRLIVLEVNREGSDASRKLQAIGHASHLVLIENNTIS